MKFEVLISFQYFYLFKIFCFQLKNMKINKKGLNIEFMVYFLGISESGVIGRFSKSLTEENALNIMCQLTNVQGSIDTCLFERPDGKGFLYNEGIGKGRYRSYKFGSRSDSTCGLTIINPVEEDFGIWKCEMGLKNGLKSQDGAFIYIKKNENGIY